MNKLNMLGGAVKHYDTMPLEDICALPVPAADNAVLFLWVTSPMLEDAFKVINAWGFKYKSSFVWDKVSHNMGHYNSVRHELLDSRGVQLTTMLPGYTGWGASSIPQFNTAQKRLKMQIVILLSHPI